VTAVWSTPSDFAVAHIVTAAEWNAMQGASGNAVYIKDVLLTTASQASVSSSRALNTVYQNTTGKLMFVNTSFFSTNTTGTSCLVQVYVSSTSPPTAGVGQFGHSHNSLGPYGHRGGVAFVVNPGFYYTASDGGFTASSIVYWAEWTLF